MANRILTLVVAALLTSISLSARSATARAAVVTSDVSPEIAIQDVTVQDSSVSGTLVNNSSKTLRDVQLQVRQAWIWADEFHPGADSPGRTLPFTLGKDIAPHASATFVFQTPPLDQRADGRFVTTVEIVRFSQVGF